MTKLFKLAFTLFTFLVLNGGRQQEAVEGVEWISGQMTKLDKAEEVRVLLDKLYEIPSNDISESKVNDTVNLISNITLKLKDLGSILTAYKASRFEIISRDLSSFLMIPEDLKNFQEVLSKIDKKYNLLQWLLANFDLLSPLTKRSFAEGNLEGNTDSVKNLVSKAYFLYFENNDHGPLVDHIASVLSKETKKDECQMFSIQQHFYSDYWEWTILQIKGYLLNKLSWTILNSLENKVFENEEVLFCQQLEARVAYQAFKFGSVISTAERVLRRCNPPQWKEKENFDQLTRFVQGYIVNEASLNENFTCKKECKSYKNMTIPGCYRKDPYCQNEQGTGTILECDSVSRKDSLTICPSSKPSRRYNYITINRHITYGQRGHSPCPNNEVTAKSWTRGFYVCTYCFCLIDEKKNSDRFFNLREALSDTKENKVVTGIRFIKKDRVMHLQIQQGVLNPFGLVKNNSLNWKNVEEYELNEKNNGVDYITLDKHHRSVFMSNVVTRDLKYLVTGVKLTLRSFYLNLEVRITKFDFGSGVLSQSQNESMWITSDLNTEYRSLPLSYGELNRGPKLSTLTPDEAKPTLYNIVEFSHSDKKDDASQSTIPFLDTQDVISLSPTPLSGVGLYHKGTEGYGGFIAPKTFGLDLVSYI